MAATRLDNVNTLIILLSFEATSSPSLRIRRDYLSGASVFIHISNSHFRRVSTSIDIFDLNLAYPLILSITTKSGQSLI